ncbi:MAG: N-acetyltransferase family protein [Chitinophagaceae bacterium]|nr:MAG: N-acetyltransferase family protein [Chitinophagaceae bacterium]
MEFRIAQQEDLEEIVAIYNATIPGRMVTADTAPVTIEERLPWFEKHHGNRPLWVVSVDEAIIGWVSFGNFYGRPAYNGTAEISIYLHAAQQGKGYGAAILKHCIAQAPLLQIHTLLGFIFSHNAPSLRLFAKAGFEEWGCLKDVAVMDEQYYSLTILGLKIN